MSSVQQDLYFIILRLNDDENTRILMIIEDIGDGLVDCEITITIRCCRWQSTLTRRKYVSNIEKIYSRLYSTC